MAENRNCLIFSLLLFSEKIKMVNTNIQSGDYSNTSPLNDDIIHQMLSQRVAEADIEAMKADVRPFLRDPRNLDIWSKDFFADVFQRLSGK